MATKASGTNMFGLDPERCDALSEVLAERWASIREGWAITTFFLFDPESWR